MEKPEQNYNMIDWWKKVHIENYANFSGRARRAEYWYAYLANILVFLPLYIVLIIGIANQNDLVIGISGILLGLFFLGVFIPYLAVAVRRLHDTNKSGWFLLLSLVPVASLVIFIFTVLDGDKGENNYGKDPKDTTNYDELNQIGLE